MSSPLLGRNAVIKKGTQTIGFCQIVDIDADADVVKAYTLGSDKPAILESGNKTFKVRVTKLWIDHAHLSDLLSGTKVTIEVQPAGTGAGKPKITLSNVVFTGWSYSNPQDDIIEETIEGEGMDITAGTQS